MAPISVVIADAHYLIRRGLRSLIGDLDGFQVVAEAGTAEQLSGIVGEGPPDMLIMDHHSPGFDLATIEVVKESAPTTNILVISSEDDKRAINDVLERGVQSFLTKTCGSEEIANAIRATARGEKFFCTRVIDFLLEKSFAEEEDGNGATAPITARELEIVQLTARGLVAKEIASRLNLSPHTVYTHRKNIMKKLKLSSSSELVLYAVQNGMVDPE